MNIFEGTKGALHEARTQTRTHMFFITLDAQIFTLVEIIIPCSLASILVAK